MGERRFWLSIPRGLLVALLVLAVLYFVWLVLIAGRVVVIRQGTQFIDPVVWVWVGLGVFGVTLVLGLLALVPGRSRAAAAEPVEAVEAIPAAEPAYAPPAAEAWSRGPAGAVPSHGAARGDVEIKLAGEEFKGKRVLELSIPPKSEHRGAVYAKAYVPIDEAYVLRVEDLVADRRDVSA